LSSSNVLHLLVLSHTHSGGASINDVFSHASFAHAPFGGVGSSGTGSYRGRASFDAFTHRRTVATVPRWAEHLLDVRYMPYRFGKLKFARAALAPSVDFDRNGNVVRGWRWWIRRAVSVLAVVAAARALVGWGGGLDRLSGYLARLLGQK
jgi:beta-apo-4'-carotenal oxygenase